MKKGFTLIEMMIVVAIIAIIAAIAIPSLIAARKNSYDTAGAANMRAYATAQTMFIKTDWAGTGRTYAQPMTSLYQLPAAIQNGKVIALIDKGMNDAWAGIAAAPAAAAIPKQGYVFGGDDPTTTTFTADYYLCAVPKAYDRSGTRLYVINVDGRPMCKDANSVAAVATGATPSFLTVYPLATISTYSEAE